MIPSLQNVECEAGGQVIDKQYIDRINSDCDLSHSDKTKLLNELRRGLEVITVQALVVDENQPTPTEMNNLQLNEVITHPGGAQSQFTDNSHPIEIVRHSTGRLFLLKKMVIQQKLVMIDVDGSVTETTQASTLWQLINLLLQSYLQYSINSSYLTKFTLTSTGDIDFVSHRMTTD